MKHYAKIKRTSNFCIYCGIHIKEWEKVIDHFVPKAFHGKVANTPCNMFVSCRECNSIKSDKIFEDIPSARKFILGIKRKNNRQKIGKKNKIKKICKYCGKIIYGSSRKSFCNVKCRHKYMYVPKGIKTTKYCLLCGKKFKSLAKTTKCEECIKNKAILRIANIIRNRLKYYKIVRSAGWKSQRNR